MQDSRGFTWIGTDDGLNRYDGQQFEVFRNVPGKKAGISGNIITDLLEDDKGRLWISSADGGITRYDYKSGPAEQFLQFRHIPGDSSSIPVNSINAMHFDRLGRLWLATSGAGLVCFDPVTSRFIPVERGSQRTCTDICMDEKGFIWAGRQGGSYMKVDPVSMMVEQDRRYMNPYKKLPHVTVTSLYRDSRNDIWFGSWDNAVYKYNSSTAQEEVWAADESKIGLGKDEATCFVEDGKGYMWIGTKNSGLLLLDLATGEYFRHQHNPLKEGSILSNTIQCLYRDHKNNIWVGTNKGVSMFMAISGNFKQDFLPPVPGDYGRPAVNDFRIDEQGRLWLATTAGIFIRSGNIFQHLPVKYDGRNMDITRFFRDRKGNHYLGADYSFFAFDPITMQYSLLPNTRDDLVMQRIIASRVVSVAEDSVNGSPALVVSPYGHYITYYDLTQKKWISRGDSVNQIIKRFDLRDNLVRKIYKDPAGNLWMGTAKAGLARWERQSRRFRYYINDPNDPHSISNNHVMDMEADGRNHLWISTFGGGLNYCNPELGTFQHISSSVNLLEGLAIDKRGRVWMIGNGTIHQYDPALRAFRSFHIPDLEKTGGVRGDIFNAPDGSMYAGGTGFYTRFHPDSVTIPQSQPTVLITNFMVYDSTHFYKLFNQKKLKLRYNENFFNIHFSAPWYDGKVYYQYMLEGLDPRWIDAGHRQVAPYTHLNGGEYTFKVRASTVPGIWSQEPTTLSIYIVPPFWKRWWFFTVLALLFAALMYAVYRYRINELVKRQAIRNRIAQDLHDNMGSTLSSISVYSQVARIYKDQRKELELEDTLEKISVTSGEMISEMNDIVWAINPRNDNMEKIVQRMESFARPLMKAAGISFTMQYDPSLLKLNLDMEKRKNFYLIFKEAVTNAMKYSECSRLDVKILLHHDKLELEIKDNGKGFDPEKILHSHVHTLSGNGLRNMEMRAKEMGATLKIDSKKGEGTLLVLRVGLP